MRVREIDREKLALFSPDGLKYTFKVMPFGPTNAPSFYSEIMNSIKDEWYSLFLTRMQELLHIAGEDITVITTMEVHIGGENLVTRTCIIIGNILLWCGNISALFVYFECICRVFTQYQVIFRFDKCDFLKPRIEYVGHDIINDGNCPASSKFDLIYYWKLPKWGKSLF